MFCSIIGALIGAYFIHKNYGGESYLIGSMIGAYIGYTFEKETS